LEREFEFPTFSLGEKVLTYEADEGFLLSIFPLSRQTKKYLLYRMA
jgi:hypothetical protein